VQLQKIIGIKDKEAMSLIKIINIFLMEDQDLMEAMLQIINGELMDKIMEDINNNQLQNLLMNIL
jgi:hypothetical protein